MANPFVAIGNAIRPVFGGSNDTPDHTTVQLDPETQQLIREGADRADRPSSEFTADINRGAAENAASVGQDQQHANQEDSRMGGNSPHMAEALRGAYRSQTDNHIGRLLKSNDYRGQMAKADYMNQTAGAAIARQRVATQNYATLTSIYNQQEMARAQFVNSLFQIGQQGMIMGAMARNKPSQKTDMTNAGGAMENSSDVIGHNPYLNDGAL